MKKDSPQRKKNSLKKRWTQRRAQLKEKNLNLAHPVVKASYIWSIISDQLSDILGPEVHHQWFKNVRPLVISHHVLIVEVPNHFSSQWIHTHYHDLIDALLSAMDKRLSCFFISQSEKHHAPQIAAVSLSERSTTEINRHSED
jgi:chromosomal replication initiation ATPase DnaA